MTINKISLKFKSSELIGGAFWTTVGSGLSRLLITIGTILASNLLGPEKFGEFSISRSTVNVILVIAGLNLSPLITKAVAENFTLDRDKASRLVTINYLFILTLTLFLALLTFFGANYIGAIVGSEKNMKEHVELTSFILIFSIMFSLNESVYRGLGFYKRLGVWQVIAGVSYAIFVPCGAYFYNSLGALTGFFIYTIILCVITIFDIKQIVKKLNFKLFTFQNLKSELFTLKKLALPIFLASIIEAPIFWYAQIILIKYAGMAANGIASSLLQTRNLMLIVPGYVSLIVLPVLSKNLNNKEQYKKNFRNAIYINSVIATLCVVPLLLFPKFLLQLYGKGFDDNYNYWDSFFAYISIPFFIVSNVYQQSIIAKNKGWESLVISLVWNSVLVGSCFFLIKYFDLGVLGFMISMLLAVMVQFLMRKLYESK